MLSNSTISKMRRDQTTTVSVVKLNEHNTVLLKRPFFFYTRVSDFDLLPVTGPFFCGVAPVFETNSNSSKGEAFIG